MPNPVGCFVSQGFGGNPGIYDDLGFAGHPGCDVVCGYGSDILSMVEGTVCGVYTPQRPASDGYTAVFILVQTALETFEFGVGHPSEVLVKIGDSVKEGQLIAREGNIGFVYANGRVITLAMQKAGNKEGSHRHYQKRVVLDVPKVVRGKRYLQNWNGYVRSPSKGFYEWALPNNGTASCVDYGLPLFHKDMGIGTSSYYVRLLQKALGAPVELQTGYYGPKTVEWVKSFQEANKLPSTGFCGPQTRALLNSWYGQLRDTLPDPTEKLEEAQEILESLPASYQAGNSVLSNILTGLASLISKKG